MSTVKICDRCGKKIDDKRHFVKLNPVRYILGIETSVFDWNDGEYINRMERDLCGKCAGELTRFLDGQAVDGVKEKK